MQLALVYQSGLANVFDVTERRCQKCLDVPGKDGLGRMCKGCSGRGSNPGEPRRLKQGSFVACEDFCRGAKAAGATVEMWHCNMAGDAGKVQSEWIRGPGEGFADSKSRI